MFKCWVGLAIATAWEEAESTDPLVNNVDTALGLCVGGLVEEVLDMVPHLFTGVGGHGGSLGTDGERTGERERDDDAGNMLELRIEFFPLISWFRTSLLTTRSVIGKRTYLWRILSQKR